MATLKSNYLAIILAVTASCSMSAFSSWFRLSASEKTFPIVAFIAILNKLSNICAKKGLKYVTFV